MFFLLQKMLNPRGAANAEFTRHADRLDVLCEAYKENPEFAAKKLHIELTRHKRTIDTIAKENPAT